MHRLSNGTQVSILPQPASIIGTPGYATAGKIGSQAPSDIDPDTFNTHQEELAGIVEAAGIDLDKTNNAQVLTALKILFGSSADLGAEIKRAKSAESDLQSAISSEASARSGADATLQNNLVSEATTRANADALLQAEVDQSVSGTLSLGSMDAALLGLHMGYDPGHSGLRPIGVYKDASGDKKFPAFVQSVPGSGNSSIFNAEMKFTDQTVGQLIMHYFGGGQMSVMNSATGSTESGGWFQIGNILVQTFVVNIEQTGNTGGRGYATADIPRSIASSIYVGANPINATKADGSYLPAMSAVQSSKTQVTVNADNLNAQAWDTTVKAQVLLIGFVS